MPSVDPFRVGPGSSAYGSSAFEISLALQAGFGRWCTKRRLEGPWPCGGSVRHDLRMKSRVHPKYKTKYRVKNWASVWLSPEVIATWKPAGVRKRGGKLKYCDVSIKAALTLRLLFNLPLRQTEGFLNSLFAMMGLDLSAPDHTTLSRRSQHLDVRLRRIPTGEVTHLIVDSTGLSIVGEGEWAAAKHGGRGKRGWRKLHLGVDGSGVIVAQVLTDGNADDAATVPDLLGQFEGELSGSVLGTRRHRKLRR
jgi:hypothetical protein